jgi:sialate O-acetylesterase
MKRLALASLVSVVLLVPLLAGCGAGQVRSLTLPSVFSDHMVLQRDQRIPVWGYAVADTVIEVALAGQMASTTAASDGNWQVELHPLPAGGPYTLAIQDGTRRIAIRDVLVGDVWICSGQSNMVLPLADVTTGPGDIQRAQARAASALLDARIRLFRPVSPQSAEEPAFTISDASWSVATPETIRAFSAVGYFFGAYLRQSLGVPIGLMELAANDTPAQAWMPRSAFAEPDMEAIYRETERRVPQVWGGSHGSLAAVAERMPGALYNGMIAPVRGYAATGVIWYQGEANVMDFDPGQYRLLLTGLIESWRAAWHANLAFLAVQLPGYFAPGKDWPLLREQQREAIAQTGNAGLAVTIDLGSATTIHPLNKQPVGYRLALLARRIVYGQRVTDSGPTYQSVRFDGSRAIMTFGESAGGLVAHGSALTGVEIAGANQIWLPARAKIAGDDVIAWNPAVAHPVAVRYAWANFPRASLFNAAGLPAAPFRTADF